MWGFFSFEHLFSLYYLTTRMFWFSAEHFYVVSFKNVCDFWTHVCFVSFKHMCVLCLLNTSTLFHLECLCFMSSEHMCICLPSKHMSTLCHLSTCVFCLSCEYNTYLILIDQISLFKWSRPEYILGSWRKPFSVSRSVGTLSTFSFIVRYTWVYTGSWHSTMDDID